MKCSATTFVEAYANMGLSELNLHDADRNVEGKLVRRNDGGVLSVQATELKRAGGWWGCRGRPGVRSPRRRRLLHQHVPRRMGRMRTA
ncbi:unnamed protein product [Musa acuminata subsp. malaccensis]|uniref:(wild Malaysian banana) hypothetical protein n=1 Tax=Musa acuminata subsp. malaccensis TaxID=214687 RepID=A0A804JBY8_MUSAM|nr:unnamed protein product [Musa acuminata subsp. malaccensis]